MVLVDNLVRQKEEASGNEPEGLKGTSLHASEKRCACGMAPAAHWKSG